MTDPIHEQDGAYVLGALPPEDRRRYEEHLAVCSSCARSVRALAGLPGMLGVLDAAEAEALRDLPDEAPGRGGAHVPARAAGVARRIARRRRRTRLTASLVLLGALVLAGAGGWALTRSAAPAAASASHLLTPVGGSHLRAELSATPVGWGTRLDWSCDYRGPAGASGEQYAPMSYSLVVRTRDGGESTVATWTSDGGEARDLVAATAIPADSISRVDIRETGSETALAAASF